MKRNEIIPDQLASAIAMREAGYTLISISQKLGVSVRTLQRHFAKHGATKGAAKNDLVKRAKEELIASVTDVEALRAEMANLLEDDFAHVKNLRKIMASASEEMEARSLKESAQVMRAAAAYSVALKNTSDLLRNATKDLLGSVERERDIPDLVVVELTADEVRKMTPKETLI